LNKKSWSGTGPNTWLMEPKRLPSRVIESNLRVQGHLAKQDGFQLWNEAQKKHRSQVDGESVRPGVKGRDERQTTAPLTPARTPQGDFACSVRKTGLTEADAIIHGLFATAPSGSGGLIRACSNRRGLRGGPFLRGGLQGRFCADSFWRRGSGFRCRSCPR
jgi:hypothetical protein